MKILLDENIDVRFKHYFKEGPHDVFTVKDMNWTGIKNGELLQLMSAHKFDVLIAVDKNLPYQQNLTLLPVSIVILDVKRNVLANLLSFVNLISNLLEQQPLEKKVFVLQV